MEGTILSSIEDKILYNSIKYNTLLYFEDQFTRNVYKRARADKL